MFEICRKTFLILSPAERRLAIVVTLLMLVQAVAEVSGIVSIAPFLAVLGNPEVVRTNARVAWLYNLLGFTDSRTFLEAMGAMAFIVLTGSALFRGLVQYAKFRFTNMRRHTLNLRLLEKYIRQPYEYFLQSNTSQLSKTILSEVDQFIMNGLMPLLQIFSYGLVAMGIIALLLYVSLQLALLVSGTLGLFYGIVYWRLSAWIGRLGRDRRIANGVRFQITAEILGGIKELKVLGREQVYLDAFKWPSLRFARCQTTSQILSDAPRYLIETVGICTMFLVVLFLLHKNSDLGHALPIIGLYAFSGYRLLPAAQNIYGALTTLRFSAPAIEAIYSDLAAAGGPQPLQPYQDDAARMKLKREIGLRKLCFNYPGALKPALQDITLSIPALTSTGIVGATGAGKSTLVDLILGILAPSDGEIIIDDVPLSPANLRSWQANIGYVPQQIFLADDTVARNIAFGVPLARIDRNAVETAARLAQIHDFILTMPQGYDTVVGERGVRISGGQRQRLGIARALYHDPDVLIFDEATSALDHETESGVIRAVETLSDQKTIIMIAHRHDTLRKCQRIIRLDAGRAEVMTQTAFLAGIRPKGESVG
jgi:ABC-type multidrug transport system fused ATPase/permease subunit